ncbi:MAG: hypothetical protein IPL75_16095 [Acidobacteria bacterium]|nr:hypothetical protein [Acidobacteriota bacterium]
MRAACGSSAFSSSKAANDSSVSRAMTCAAVTPREAIPAHVEGARLLGD